MSNRPHSRPSAVPSPFFGQGRVRWYERLMAVSPVFFNEDDDAPGRPLNRKERRDEARLSRLHGDGRKRGGIIDAAMIAESTKGNQQ